MKQIDDMLPEETSKQYEPLLTLLRRASHKPTPLTSAEQAQSIARVQERLGLVADETAQGEGIVTQQIAPLRILPQQPRIQAMSPLRTRILRFINAFAAILVLGAIIGASLLLFRHQSQPISESVGTAGTIYARADGLEASLRVTPGPYFLSELLLADMTLTNHSRTTFQLAGFPAPTPCNPALRLNYTPTGANIAHYTFPVDTYRSCAFRMTQLKPGQSIAIRQYIPLTDSGHILLTETADFLVTKTTPNQGTSTTNGPSPLDGHWPSLHINVASLVPSDRIITLHRQGLNIFINAPAAVRSQLLYMYAIRCSDLHNPGNTPNGSYESSSYDWIPITTTFAESSCLGQKLQWTYAVSTPGYPIVSGSYTP